MVTWRVGFGNFLEEIFEQFTLMMDFRDEVPCSDILSLDGGEVIYWNFIYVVPLHTFK